MTKAIAKSSNAKSLAKPEKGPEKGKEAAKAVLKPQVQVGADKSSAAKVVPPSVNPPAAPVTIDPIAVLQHGENLLSDKPTPVASAAKAIEELATVKPEHLIPIIDRLVSAVISNNKRSIQTAAIALPVMARLAPAKVARHLPQLTEKFAFSSDPGKDGLVSTFAALCTASVAYQKRLEPVLEVALSTADPKTLARWTETILPSLKGEPHARARAVVERRLYEVPRLVAQPIAAFLGIKLRPANAK